MNMRAEEIGLDIVAITIRIGTMIDQGAMIGEEKEMRDGERGTIEVMIEVEEDEATSREMTDTKEARVDAVMGGIDIKVAIMKMSTVHVEGQETQRCTEMMEEGPAIGTETGIVQEVESHEALTQGILKYA